jgi:hypothetical protein
MTAEQSRKLKIGQRVAWEDSTTDKGMIKAIDWSGVQIAWANGSEQFFHHNNMGKINTAAETA